MNKVAPAPSIVHKDISEIMSLAIEFLTDYREAYFVAYKRGGKGEVYVALRGHSDPTGDTVADKENRRVGLALGASKLEEALKEIRSAKGLITGGLDPVAVKAGRASEWTPKELVEAEVRAKTLKRRTHA